MAIRKKGDNRRLTQIERDHAGLTQRVGGIESITQDELIYDIDAMRREIAQKVESVERYEKFFESQENKEKLQNIQASLNVDETESESLLDLQNVKEDLRFSALDIEDLQDDAYSYSIAQQQRELQRKTTMRITAGFASGAALGAMQTYIGTESTRTGDAISQRRNQELMSRARQGVGIASAAIFLSPGAGAVALGSALISEGFQESARRQSIDRENKTTEYKQQLLGRMSNNRGRD